MNKFSIHTGRINQKAQTRTKILHAAKRILGKKKSISLEDIAKEANVSRATVYRYYSNVDILITEAALDINHKLPEEITEDAEGLELQERVLHIQKYYNDLAFQHETAFRRYLSAVLSESVSSKKKHRGARRVKTLELALKPYKKKIDKRDYKKLISTATILMGIDPIVAGKDVCGLDNDEIQDTLQWALSVILKGMDI